jgi:hypothetical protein
MIDIITVVFPQELNLLRTQAESVGRYCTRIGVRNIYVVLNGSDTMLPDIDPAWWGELGKHLLVIPRSAFSTTFVDNGWVSQQALKMLAASMSYNAWSMVLDAKTVFVREVNTAELTDSEGRMRVGELSVYPVFEPSRLTVNRLWDIDLQRQLGPGGVPFFFHNNTVRYMISECTFRTGEMFPEFFQRHGTLTEFLLYSGYVESKPGMWDLLYSGEAAFTCVNIGREEVKDFDWKFKGTQDPRCLTVSVHRDAWPRLTPVQQGTWRNMLIDRGISGAFFL